MISKEQVRLALDMYVAGEAIADIMAATGIRSTQTIYKHLGAAGLGKRPPKPARKISVMLDEEAAALLDKDAPRNVSAWVCERIKARA